MDRAGPRHRHVGLAASGCPARAGHEPARATCCAGSGRHVGWPTSSPPAASGIKDLRFGNVVDADWDGHDPDDRISHRTEVPLHVGPRHFVVLGTVVGRHESRRRYDDFIDSYAMDSLIHSDYCDRGGGNDFI